jgi:hypothetical protein
MRVPSARLRKVDAVVLGFLCQSVGSDLMRRIMEFIPWGDRYISMCDDPDLWWHSAGVEACNLGAVLVDFEMLVGGAFGKSHKFTKALSSGNMLSEVRGRLDTALCMWYGIRSPEEDAFLRRFHLCSLTQVFVSIATISPERLMYNPCARGREKRIPHQEAHWLMEFKARLCEFVRLIDSVDQVSVTYRDLKNTKRLLARLEVLTQIDT